VLFGVTLHQFLTTGFLAVVFILLFKWAAARTGIAGLQNAAAAV
jgi:hypothetical protein